ncbi:MAG: YIP1 family protein [Vampirovibrio sp.]|nr:YIP1 family protein [Vampirovibrio sp.]
MTTSNPADYFMLPSDGDTDENQGGFFNLFYGTLFHPVKTFQKLQEVEPTGLQLFYGMIFILLVSGMAPVLTFVLKASADPLSLAFEIPLKAVFGLFVWFSIGSLLNMVAYAFTSHSRLRTFLTLSALSTLPWFFMGPLALLKIGLGGFGITLNVLAGLGIWLWSVVLFALALGVTYKLSAERVIIVLLMPFPFFSITLAWITGFFINVGQLLP